MSTSCHYFRLRRTSLRIERQTRVPEVMEPKPSHSRNAFARRTSIRIERTERDRRMLQTVQSKQGRIRIVRNV